MLAVSYRQAKRLVRRNRAEGAKGLTHRSAGVASNHARPAAEREQALALVREKYSGPVGVRFVPTLAAEHLASEDRVTVHHDTLRRWMLTAGLRSRAHAQTRFAHRPQAITRGHFYFVKNEGFVFRVDSSVQTELVDEDRDQVRHFEKSSGHRRRGLTRRHGIIHAP